MTVDVQSKKLKLSKKGAVAVMNKNCSNYGLELLEDTIVCDLCGG
jgi:hypothetical protein